MQGKVLSNAVSEREKRRENIWNNYEIKISTTILTFLGIYHMLEHRSVFFNTNPMIVFNWHGTKFWVMLDTVRAKTKVSNRWCQYYNHHFQDQFRQISANKVGMFAVILASIRTAGKDKSFFRTTCPTEMLPFFGGGGGVILSNGTITFENFV